MIPTKNNPKISPQEAEELRAYYDDGRQVDYVRDILGSPLWHKQQEIVAAVFKYPIVAVKSANSTGKSHVSADIALAFLNLKPGSIVITTAPTWRQVKDVLWRYIRRRLNMSARPLTEAQATQVGLDIADDWYAVGLSTKDSEKFFGYHADDILVIVDEASGVEEEIFLGVDAVTPNINAHVLMIGNPTNPDGRFFKAFRDPLVKCFTISAFDTPNFTANGIKDTADLVALFKAPPNVTPLDHFVSVKARLQMPIPQLINPANAYQRLVQWGEDSPMWQALVLGEFPSQASNSLIPLNLIMKAVDVHKQMVKLRSLVPGSPEWKEYKVRTEWRVSDEGELEYGLDVARFGDDRTVLIERRGGFVQKISDWAYLDTHITGERVIEAMNMDDWQAIVKVDDTGVGGGVTDHLRHAAAENPDVYHYRTVPINFGAGTHFPDKYFNLRAEMFWNLRQQFFKHQIAIPEDEDLIYELASIRYDFTGKDKQIIQIEPKSEIKKRSPDNKSPDKADALALAYMGSGAGRWLQEFENNDLGDTLQNSHLNTGVVVQTLDSDYDEDFVETVDRSVVAAPVTSGIGDDAY